MNRSLFITIHMYLSAFFAPFIFLIAISGGLYLIGVKGSVQQESVFASSEISIDAASDQLFSDVGALLQAAGVTQYEFEYVKVKGDVLYTRPTSRQHYMIKLGDSVELIRVQPSLQAALMELHKGHGPTGFKTFQKIFALGLLLIVTSGLWLGLSAQRLRQRTLLISLSGTGVFLLLVLL
jgi:hypothetical protein